MPHYKELSIPVGHRGLCLIIGCCRYTEIVLVYCTIRIQDLGIDISICTPGIIPNCKELPVAIGYRGISLAVSSCRYTEIVLVYRAIQVQDLSIDIGTCTPGIIPSHKELPVAIGCRGLSLAVRGCRYAEIILVYCAIRVQDLSIDIIAPAYAIMPYHKELPVTIGHRWPVLFIGCCRYAEIVLVYCAVSI